MESRRTPLQGLVLLLLLAVLPLLSFAYDTDVAHILVDYSGEFEHRLSMRHSCVQGLTGSHMLPASLGLLLPDARLLDLGLLVMPKAPDRTGARGITDTPYMPAGDELS